MSTGTAMRDAVGPAAVRGECATPATPYLGLRFYTEADAALFFGRDAERQVIMGNLRASRLTLLYAQSGAGKSSLLRAGVAARLRELAERTLAEGGSTCFVPVVVSSWKEDPVDELIGELERVTSSFAGTGSQVRLPRESLPSAIHAAAEGIEQSATGDAWERPTTTLLIILDQFEEYFLYGSRDARSGRLADEIADCLKRADVPANFLISIREDAYSALGDLFKGRVSNVYGNYLHLEFLAWDEARTAIEKPLERFNRGLPDDEHVSIEPGLVDDVLADIATTESGAVEGDAEGPARPASRRERRRVETPYLQLVMERLWTVATAAGERVLRRATLAQLGGSKQIVRAHLERSLDALSEEQRSIAAAAFRFMVTSSKTKIAQRAHDLADWTGHPEADIAVVLERLTSGEQGRILRPLAPVPGESGVRYELFHDVLAEPVSEWRKTYEEDRRREALAARMREEERERLAAARARHAAQLKRVAIAATVVIGVLAIAVVAAVRVIAEEREARSKTLSAVALSQLDTDPERGLLLAREAWSATQTPAAEQAVRRALSASLVRRRIDAGAPLWSADATTDGSVIATLADNEVRLWRADDGGSLGGAKPGGELYAVAMGKGKLVVAGEKGAVVGSLRSRAAPLRLGAERAVYAAAISDDDRYVATLGDEMAAVWDAATGERVVQEPYDATGWSAIEFNPRDSGSIALASCELGGPGQAALWSWAERASVTLPTGRRAWSTLDSACGLAFSPDGRRLLTAPNTNSVTLWTADGRKLARRSVSLRGVDDLAWAPNGRAFAAAGGKAAQIFRARDGRLVASAGGAADWVTSIDFSGDGELLIAAGQDGTARVYDVALVQYETYSAKQLVALRGHTGAVNAAQFLGTGTRVLTASDDGTARIWDVGGSRAFRARDWVLDAAYSPDGKRVAVAVGAQDLRDGLIFDIATGAKQPIEDVSGQLLQGSSASFGSAASGGSTTLVAFDGKGDLVLLGGRTASGGGAIIVADGRTGEQRALPRLTSAPIQTAEFSPHGRHILATTTQDTLLFRTDSAQEPRTITALPEPVYGATYSPDGQLIVAGDKTGRVRVIDAGTLRERHVYKRHDGLVIGAGFSPDGSRIVSYGFDRTARVTDVRTGRLVATLRGHTSWIASAAFSPDGRRIVTGGADRTLRVWDSSTGELLALESPHADSINSVSFSPDGRSILSASDDGTARITRCETCGPIASLLKLAESRVTRGFTASERREFLGD
jgi:WD40 repeat protein